MTTPSLTGVTTLGKVVSENYSKSAQIEVTSQSFESDDAEALIFGFNGAIGVITVKGVITGDEATLSNAVDEFRTACTADPTQSSGQRVWRSPLFPSGIDVVIIDVNCQYNNDIPTVLDYQLKLTPGQSPDV